MKTQDALKSHVQQSVLDFEREIELLFVLCFSHSDMLYIYININSLHPPPFLTSHHLFLFTPTPCVYFFFPFRTLPPPTRSLLPYISTCPFPPSFPFLFSSLLFPLFFCFLISNAFNSHFYVNNSSFFFSSNQITLLVC